MDLLRVALRARGRKGSPRPAPALMGFSGPLPCRATMTCAGPGGGDGPLSAHHRALPQTLRPYPFPLPAASPPRKLSLQVIIMVTHSINFHQAPSSAPARGRHTGDIGGWAWVHSSSSRAGRPPGVRRCWDTPVVQPAVPVGGSVFEVDARGPHCGRLSWLLAGLPAGGRYTRQGQACEVGATQRS